MSRLQRGDVGAIRLAPQEGPQTAFLACTADIAIYGGAAGGGKSYGLLLETLRHHDNAKFGGVIFRRNSVQVRNEGGLWDESMNVFPLFGARPREATLEWNFPSKMRMKFAHLEYDNTVLDWQGTSIPFIGFDELTHFSEYQFTYMMTRNRSTSGVRPYMRATTNPDPDSWVRTFIDWWIGPDGYAIPERSGVIRWFIRRDDAWIWADSPEEIYAQYGNGPEIMPKSVTFIAAKLQDNKILMREDPGYMANLLAQNRVDRERLLNGNWNVKPSAGMMFQRDWFTILDAIPSGWIRVVRFWDRAATKPNETNKDPDWTRGLKLYKYPNGTWLVGDIKSIRDTPGQVDRFIKTVASQDGVGVPIRAHQDPGSAGVHEAEAFIKMLAGYDVNTAVVPRDSVTNKRDKITRAKPVSAQAEFGNVFVLRAPWNEDFFTELENFPEVKHDDQVDTLSGSFNELAGGLSIADVL